MCPSWAKQSTGARMTTKVKKNSSTSTPLSSLCFPAQGWAWGVWRWPGFYLRAAKNLNPYLHLSAMAPKPSLPTPASGRTLALPGEARAGEAGLRGVPWVGRGWTAGPARLYWPKAKKTTPKQMLRNKCKRAGSAHTTCSPTPPPTTCSLEPPSHPYSHRQKEILFH